MNLIDQTVFLLLRVAIQGQVSIEEAKRWDWSKVDWDGVCELAFAHNVAAIVFDGVLKLYQNYPDVNVCLPRAIKMRLAAHQSALEVDYDKHSKVISRLALFYKSHEIPMMLLKGYGLSLYYPCPSHRPCGDIDIWLYGEQARADELLRSEYSIQIDEEKHHHTVFYVGGIMVENHYDFFNVHAHRSNRIIEARLKELAVQDSEKISVEGGEVLIPSADFNVLFLLRHAAAHFAAAEINIRHVLDWALFVSSCSQQIDWVALDNIARKLNMHRFMYSLNAMSIDCLGFSPRLFAPFERDAKLERRVMADILSPEFNEQPNGKGLIKMLNYKLRRWWCNRWKHRIVYNETLFSTFFVQLWSHALKPQSFIK